MEQAHVAMTDRCVEIKVRGTVQGVGFRPFVYRLAMELGIKGAVSNTEEGVVIVAQADESTLERFMKAIRQESPPMSVVRSLSAHPCRTDPARDGFVIVRSSKKGKVTTEISPDMATCKDCLGEILDPGDRRYGYPFTNCTNCGPRYTIIKALPYDRAQTSMHSFTMCARCRAEYDDPLDRRFHAQPNACPECGPRVFVEEQDAQPCDDRPIPKAAALLGQGKIVAVKGLGGFHLACSAFSDNAVSILRARKSRPFKPLALMVRDLETADRIGVLDSEARHLLSSPRAPIVLVPKRPRSPVSRLVAPGIGDIGMMLPYTPLHHLLFQSEACPQALVMTSGNPKDEPLCTDNEEAKTRLAGFVDAFLLHDRDIFTGVDDSVLKTTSAGCVFIRRSRGYAPSPIDFTVCDKTILGAGAHLKNTFCITKKGSAYLSQHIGDLVTGPTYDFYRRNIFHLSRLIEAEPEIVACDLHPDYLSTRFCSESGKRIIRVQHHFAHAASVMAENRMVGPCIAVCLDGTGLGTDGTVWGGEILLCTPSKFERLGRLRPFPLPGGDACARQPWRSALSLVHECQGLDGRVPEALMTIDSNKRKFVTQMIRLGVNSPIGSSCGRLFDAAAALCGLRMENTYEAQAAMEMEALCMESMGGIPLAAQEWFLRFFTNDEIIRTKGDILELDWRPVVEAAAGNGMEPGEFSVLFHCFVVAGFGRMALLCSDRLGIDSIVLSGGCMQNRVLMEAFTELFASQGIKALTNRSVPANDGGISLGQAFVAAHITGE